MIERWTDCPACPLQRWAAPGSPCSCGGLRIAKPGYEGSPYGKRPDDPLVVERTIELTDGTRVIDEFEHRCFDKRTDDGECMACAVRDCPDNEPLHYHHDGCPCCSFREDANGGNDPEN